MTAKDDIQLREFVESAWFRVEARHWSISDDHGDHSYTQSELVFLRIPVEKHTPKGAWLKSNFMARRLVLRDYIHRGRAYAAPTLEQAKEDFRKRKQFHINRLQGQINKAERDIAMLDHPIREL